MPRWTRHLPRAALFTSLAALAAACTDRTPTGARPGPEGPTGPDGEPVTLQALQCHASRDRPPGAWRLGKLGDWSRSEKQAPRFLR